MFSNYAGASSLVAGLVLPAIVALFTRPSTNSTVKGAAHAVLSVATGFWAVRQAEPQHFYWAPAIVASVLAWVTGTTFYHSLLKKYAWFGWLQNTLVTETGSRLHISPGTVARYVEVSQVAETKPAAAALNDAVVEQIGKSVEDAVRRALGPVVQRAADTPPAAAATIVLPKVNGLGTRSV